MRAKARVKDRVVFENNHGSFDGVECGAALTEDGPASGKSALATGFACIDSFIGNVPGTAVNNERRFHG
jgi:hypothetical protein